MPRVMTAAAAAAATTAMVLLLILAVDLLPRGPMIAHLKASFENGSLQDNDWPWRDRVNGFDQYDDCLLAMMVAFRGDPLASAVAPVVAFGNYPTQVSGADGAPITQCAMAKAAIWSDAPRALYEPERYFPYSRYVHGYRVPFNALISVTDVGTIRILYRGAEVAILLAMLAVHLRRAVRATGRDTPAAAEAAGFATIAGALLLFYGIDIFGQSLTRAPADLVLFGALFWLSLTRVPPGGGGWEIRAAVLSAIAFALDFLQGATPMLFAAVLGAAALRSATFAVPLALIDLLRLIAALVTGVVAAVATKLLAIPLLSGTTGTWDFFHQLAYRMAGEHHTLADAYASLRRSGRLIGWGQSAAPFVALVIGLLSAAAAFGLLLAGRIAPERCVAVLAGLVSVATVFVWFAVFRNHTAIHGGFMVRLLAWPIGMGVATLVLALVSGRDRGADTG